MLDTLVGAVLICAALIAGRWIGIATRDPLHPLAVFTLVWIGVFGFAHFRFSEIYTEPYYADPFGSLTYLVVLAAYASFAIGFGLVARRLEPLNREAVSVRLQQVAQSRELAWTAIAVFAVATLTTFWFVRVAGEIPLFSPNVNTSRRTFQLPILGYFYHLHILAALLFVMMAFRQRGSYLRVIWLSLAAASMVMLLFGGVRASALAALAWIGVYAAYARFNFSRRAMVLVAIFGIAIFVAVESARRRPLRENPELVNPRIDTSVPATLWAHTGASFKNLQLTVMEHASPLNMGLNSYDLPKTLFPSTREVDRHLASLYGTHNTPTFLGFLYLDFGAMGLILMPGVYGALVAFVYGRFRKRANLFWLLIHIDFFLAVSLSFRTHRFLGNNLIFFGGVALMIQLFFRWNSPRGTEAPFPEGSAAPEGRLAAGRPAGGAVPGQGW